MASAAEIAANSNSYVGNQNLGGGSFGSVKLDLRPIEDLAKYTMLYNRSEYEQRQKDAEAAAKEIADYTSYDLNTGIPKDAKLLQEKYDKLTTYMRENPEALNYKNKEQWAKYNELKNDLNNDLQGAKIRNTMWAMRQKEIQDEKDPNVRALKQADLDSEIEATDIRTPIKHSQKYDDSMPEIPKPNGVSFDVTVQLPNSNVNRDFDILDMGKVWSNANVNALALDAVNVDPTTPDGKRKAIAKGNDFWQKGSATYNTVLQSAKKEDGTIDKTKLDNISLSLYNLAERFNQYSQTKKAEINAGTYKDKLGNDIQFGGTYLKEQDYRGVNVDDGISPEELSALAQFASWKGDGYKTTVQETDDAIQGQQIATTRRGQDLDYKVAWHNANKAPASSGAATAQSGITTPAILFGEHINRVKNYFNTPGRANLTVNYSGIDEKTRGALKIEEGQRVIYNNDGSFVIQTPSADNKKSWTDLRVGTIEDLKQGYINVAKGGMGGDGTQTEGFQSESEKGFNSIFGTTSGSTIFNGWGKQATTTTPGKNETPEERAKRIANE